jgi:heme-degrading monooxygenase HmoA
VAQEGADGNAEASKLDPAWAPRRLRPLRNGFFLRPLGRVLVREPARAPAPAGRFHGGLSLSIVLEKSCGECRTLKGPIGNRPMVLEIAQIDVKPGMEQQFEGGVRKAAPLFKRAKGCSGMALQRSHEKPQRYRLFVKWGTLENHTVDFRGSADFQEWRKLVGDCFASPPEVEHVTEVVKGF